MPLSLYPPRDGVSRPRGSPQPVADGAGILKAQLPCLESGQTLKRQKYNGSQGILCLFITHQPNTSDLK